MYRFKSFDLACMVMYIIRSSSISCSTIYYAERLQAFDQPSNAVTVATNDTKLVFFPLCM